METSVGPLPAMLPPATIEGVEPVMGPIPDLGAHTDAILGGLGFDRATIAGWRADGMV
jgi:crotonobetainyl-CoA:carnitine CoA-transferase CaiB-like acyl-CoA transferase